MLTASPADKLHDFISLNAFIDYMQHHSAWAIAFACLILFAESGIFLACFLPGDTLLFATGLLINGKSVHTPLWAAIAMMAAAAFAGNVVGYWTGSKVGPRLFQREESRFFKKHYVDDAHAFMEKHGVKAIVMARFVGIVRSFITAVAGIAGMDRRIFFTWSAVGAVLWTGSLTTAGYYLAGQQWIKDHIDSISLGIIVVSLIPVFITALRARSAGKNS